MTHPSDDSPTPSFSPPAWLRVAFVVVLGLVTPALGRRVGRLVGNEGAGAAIAAALFVALLVFMTVRREGNGARAALQAFAGGVVVGVLFWLFSR